MSAELERQQTELESISGVSIKYLRTFPDDRGFFREIIRASDPFFAEGFGQWSHSKMQRNTVKAWHFHHRQVDWWYVGAGVIDCALYDNRPESDTYKKLVNFKMGESELDSEAITAVVKIPTGVLHGLKVLSDFAFLFYITSQIYDPKDEGRIPFNSELVPFSWGDNNSELIVAANDRKLHIPPYDRSTISSSI